MSEKKGFDDVAKEGLIALLENFWILREQDPETYQIIRDRENALKDYVLDKLGYPLIVHGHFAKLEKIPAQPEAWMGIEIFQQPRDYAPDPRWSSWSRIRASFQLFWTALVNIVRKRGV